MNTRWTFRALRTSSGNVIADWLGQDFALRARVDSYLRRLREMQVPWPYPYYAPLGDGIGEIRLDRGNVEHRLYGCFVGGQFLILIASSEKKRQQAMILGAKKLKKHLRELETEEYVV